MKVASLSYNLNLKYRSPEEWLDRTGFYAGVLQRLAQHCEVIDIHFINFEGVRIIGNVTHHFLKPLYRPFPVRFHRYLKQLRPDIVVVHGLTVPWQVILLRWQLGKNTRILIQNHNEKPGRFPRSMLQKMADRYVEAYLFTSAEQAAPWLRQRIIAHRDKVKQLFEGSSAFRAADRNATRDRLGIASGAVYLWVGRLIAVKDPLTVVKAFLRFLNQGHQATLCMIFQTTDLLEDIKALLKAHGDAASSIHLVGEVDHHDLGHWYNSADFFLLGSHDEGTNISLCEAMSCGCVPIVPNIPAFRAMTDNGEYGLLFPAGDEERLFHKLVESSRLDLPSARQKVLNQFRNKLSFDAIARKLITILSGKEKD